MPKQKVEQSTPPHKSIQLNKPLNSQRGFADIILIAVVAILLLGLGGYVYYQQKQANKTYDASGNGVTVTKNTTKKASTASTLAIKEYGVEGKTTSGVTLEYSVVKRSSATGQDSIYFSSKELSAKESSCSTTAKGASYVIYRGDKGTNINQSMIENIGKKVGTSYYYETAMPEPCTQSTDAAVVKLQNDLSAAVKTFYSSLTVTP